MENITLSEANIKALNTKITKAINSIPDEEIQEKIMDYIDNELDNLFSNSETGTAIGELIAEVVRNVFIEKGLIKKEV